MLALLNSVAVFNLLAGREIKVNNSLLAEMKIIWLHHKLASTGIKTVKVQNKHKTLVHPGAFRDC